jgi:TATA-box binding protein (TBP) (component of TFIID and TFIIIB)
MSPFTVLVTVQALIKELLVHLDITNIDKYLSLNTDDILTVNKTKTLLKLKKKNKIIQKDSKPSFYNQITVVIRLDHGYIENLEDAKKINMKLFKNGSIQMSGCKSTSDINIVLSKLITILETEETGIISVINFKIDNILANYKINLEINRNKLFELLQKKKIQASYEPCIRACVVVKHTPVQENEQKNQITISIFKLGNVLIAGARSDLHLIEAYEYLNDIILTHREEIISTEIANDEQLILHLYKEVMKGFKVGLYKNDNDILN